MNLRKMTALLAIGAATALLLCSFGPPANFVQWRRGTLTGTSLSGSEGPTDSITGPWVNTSYARRVYWEVYGDSTTVVARCSTVVVQVSMDQTELVALGSEFNIVDSLTTRNINAAPRWLETWCRDTTLSTSEKPGIPWKYQRLIVRFYGIQARNLSTLNIGARTYY